MSYFYENDRQQRVTPPNGPWVHTSRNPPPVQPAHAHQTVSRKISYQRHLSYGGCPQGYPMAPRPQYWNHHMAAAQQYSFTCRTAGSDSAEHPAYVTIRPMQQRTVPAQPSSPRPIRIRDPNQGGRDITEEIMSGVRRRTATFTPTPAPEEQVGKFASGADDETRTENDNEQNRERDRAEAAPECNLASEHPAEPALELSAEPLAGFANDTWAECEVKQTTEPDTLKAAFVREHDSGNCFTLADPFLNLPAEPLTELSTESPAGDKVGGMQGRDTQYREVDGPESAPPHKPAPKLMFKSLAEIAHALMAGNEDEPNTETDWDEEPASGPLSTKAFPIEDSTRAQKPKGLPRISRVINETRLKRAGRAGRLDAAPDFLPRYLKNLGSTPGEGSKPLKDATKEPRKFTPATSIDNKVQLNKAEHAWRPSPGKSARGRRRGGQEEATDGDPEQVKTQQLFKRLRSILNKLTPQKFGELMKQVKELTIDTTERLEGAIELIFEKAIAEPNFSVAYASMCSYLTKLNSLRADKRGVNVKFHKVLLNRCQEEFERDRDDDEMLKKKQKGLEAAKDDEERERLTLELEEARYKARRRSISNMKFMGELFKLNMITASIMDGCVQKLLRNGDEESLECLSTLLSTTGKNLDDKNGKPCMDKNFNQIETIIKERKTSSRIRFMLQDLVDLRENKWVPRREDQGPKTIDQIHKEAKMEEQMVHQQLLAMEEEEDVTGKSARGRGCRTPEDPRTGQAQTVGWNTMNRPISIAPLRATLARDVHNSTEPQRHDANATTEPGRKGWDPGSEDHPPLVDLKVEPRRTPASTCPPKPALSAEEVERKSNTIIADYLCYNIKDVLQSVTELQSASLLSAFVRHTVESALDRSSVERERIGLLLHRLVKAGTLTAQQYYKGLEETLVAAEDIATDVPHIWRYLAEIITPMLCEGGIPVGQLFREISRPLVQLGKAGILLAEILKLRRKTKSPEKVGATWTHAGRIWSHFLPQAKNQPIVMSQRSLIPH